MASSSVSSLRNVGNYPLRDLHIHARNCSGRAQLAQVKKKSVHSALGSGCEWFREQSMYSTSRNWV
jgi:hypothetical protein